MIGKCEKCKMNTWTNRVSFDCPKCGSLVVCKNEDIPEIIDKLR